MSFNVHGPNFAQALISPTKLFPLLSAAEWLVVKILLGHIWRDVCEPIRMLKLKCRRKFREIEQGSGKKVISDQFAVPREDCTRSPHL